MFLKTGADIAAAVKKSHLLLLPESVIKTIDATISDGKLQPEATYSLIDSAINQVKKQNFSWRHANNPPGVHSAFVIDATTISHDDIVSLQYPVRYKYLKRTKSLNQTA